MSTVKSKKLQVGTDATSSNNFTIYQPSTPDGTLRIGVGNADSPTEVGRFTSAGYKPATAPAFSAYGNATVSVPNGTTTKVNYNLISFDTNNCYDTSNSRFTPTVAGYYQINASFFTSANPNGITLASISKNGSRHMYGTGIPNNTGPVSLVSSLVYCNGTTDYIEIYIYQSSGSTLNCGSNQFSLNFQGYLIQQA